MKILVAVKRVIDYNVQVRVKEDGTGVVITPKIQQLKVEEPPKRKAGIKVSSVAELVQKLKNEAKVI